MKSLYFDRKSEQYKIEDRDLAQGSEFLDHDIILFIESEIIPMITAKSQVSNYGMQNLRTVLYYSIAHDSYYRKLVEMSKTSRKKHGEMTFSLDVDEIESMLIFPAIEDKSPRMLSLGELRSGRYKSKDGGIDSCLKKDFKHTAQYLAKSLNPDEAHKLVDYKSCVTVISKLKEYIRDGGSLEDIDINNEYFKDFAYSVEDLRELVQELASQSLAQDKYSYRGMDFKKIPGVRIGMPDFRHTYAEPQRDLKRFINSNLIAQKIKKVSQVQTVYDTREESKIDDSELEPLLDDDGKLIGYYRPDKKIIERILELIPIFNQEKDKDGNLMVSLDDEKIKEILSSVGSGLKDGAQFTAHELVGLIKSSQEYFREKSREKKSLDDEKTLAYVKEAIRTADTATMRTLLLDMGMLAVGCGWTYAILNYFGATPEIMANMLKTSAIAVPTISHILMSLDTSKAKKIKKLHDMRFSDEEIADFIGKGYDLGHLVEHYQGFVDRHNRLENTKSSTITAEDRHEPTIADTSTPTRRRRRQNRENDAEIGEI